MQIITSPRHVITLIALAAVIFVASLAVFTSAAADETQAGEAVFNGKDLDGWQLRHPSAAAVWSVVSDVRLDRHDPNKLIGSSERKTDDGILFRDSAPHGVDIMTEKKFGDCQVHCEWMVPENSNSGVYLEGEYEVQILSETYKKKDNQLDKGDCGAVYDTQAPSAQAETAPGQWQTYDIIFRAPRFDDKGNKTQNARFISVKLNGKEVQKNVEAPHPTGGQLGPEVDRGPLLLQGDHGVIAFRHIRVKELDLK